MNLLVVAHFLVVLAYWVAMCIAVAFVASLRKRRFSVWFAVSLFFSPLMGVLLLIATPLRVTYDPRNAIH